MQIEFFQKLAEPQVAEARRVVIRNRQGTIVAVAIELADGLVQAYTFEDPRFEQVLGNLGLNRSEVQIRHRDAPTLSDVGF
jgi:hypothetical protein